MRNFLTVILLINGLLFTGCEDDKPKVVPKKSVETANLGVSSSYLTASWSPDQTGACKTEIVESRMELKGIDFNGGIQDGNAVFLNANGIALMRAELSVIEKSIGGLEGSLYQEIPILRFQGSIAGRNVDAKSTVLSLSPDKTCIYKVSYLIRVE